MTISTYAIAGTVTEHCDSAVVFRFRINYPINISEIKEDFSGNAASFSRINEFLYKSPRIDSIIIYSSASPDGSFAFNSKLARERGKRAEEYILKHLPVSMNPPVIILNPTAENWNGLYELVEDSYPFDDRSDVLSLLERNDITDSYRKILLKKLNGGKPWKFLREHILPELRYATWVTHLVKNPMIPVVPAQEYAGVVEALATPVLQWTFPTPESKSSPETKTILALRSNLLYDALTLLNYSVEIPVYRNHASLVIHHQFPWWLWGQSDNEYCVRYLSVGTEARWWFAPRPVDTTEMRIRRDKFTGHFLGLYCESGKYDFQFRRSVCYQGEFWSAGLSYGYALPVGKRLNLELSVSAGYASIPYRGYTPSDDYMYLWRDLGKTGRLHYWGPTKAQVTLVVPITVKIGKGGKI